MSNLISKFFKMHPTQKVPYLILIITVILLIVLSWTVGTVIKEQREVIENQATASERAEERTQELKDSIEDLLDNAVETIREEVRTPAGQRAETHQIARDVERLLEELVEELQDAS